MGEGARQYNEKKPFTKPRLLKMEDAPENLPHPPTEQPRQVMDQVKIDRLKDYIKRLDLGIQHGKPGSASKREQAFAQLPRDEQEKFEADRKQAEEKHAAAGILLSEIDATPTPIKIRKALPRAQPVILEENKFRVADTDVDKLNQSITKSRNEQMQALLDLPDEAFAQELSMRSSYAPGLDVLGLPDFIHELSKNAPKEKIAAWEIKTNLVKKLFSQDFRKKVFGPNFERLERPAKLKQSEKTTSTIAKARSEVSPVVPIMEPTIFAKVLPTKKTSNVITDDQVEAAFFQDDESEDLQMTLNKLPDIPNDIVRPARPGQVAESRLRRKIKQEKAEVKTWQADQDAQELARQTLATKRRQESIAWAEKKKKFVADTAAQATAQKKSERVAPLVPQSNPKPTGFFGKITSGLRKFFGG